MIGAVRVLADEGEKAAPIIAPLLDFLPVALNSPVPSLPFHFFYPKIAHEVVPFRTLFTIRSLRLSVEAGTVKSGVFTTFRLPRVSRARLPGPAMLVYLIHDP